MRKGSRNSQETKDKIAKARTHPRRIPGTLTEIEKEVLHLRLQGYRNRAIAKKLYLEYQTVKNIINRAYKILGIRNHRHSHNMREVRTIFR